MGSDQSATFPTEPPAKPTETGIFRSPNYANIPQVQRDGRFPDKPELGTFYDIFEDTLKTNPTDPYYGSRAYENGRWCNHYNWINRAQFKERRDSIGAYLIENGAKLEEHVGILSYSRLEWVLAQHACFAYGFIPVPVYDTFGMENMKYIIDFAKIRYIFVISKKLGDLLKLKCESITHIIVIDDEEKPYNPEDFKELIQQTNATIIPFNDLDKVKTRFDPRPPKPETPASIMFTSGTTGPPKGCILPHKSLVATASTYYTFVYPFSSNDTFFSFLPLAHVYEMVLHFVTTKTFMRVGFYSGSTKRLVDDMKILKPTVICAVPRVYERVMDGMTKGLAQKPFLVRSIFNAAFSVKSFFSRNFHIRHIPGLDKVFQNFNDAIGGNLKLAICGGAALPVEIQNFVKIACNISFIQGYGLTETAAGTFVQSYTDTNDNNVGVPLYCCSAKLRDVPEMGYFAKNNQGELLVKSATCFQGYYLDQAKTDSVFEDGWFITGDIYQVTKYGQFQMVGRAKDLVKLTQGEYVSLTKLTEAYSSVQYVNQIFVYAGLHSRFLVAVVVLDPHQPGYDKVTPEQMVELLSERADEKQLNGYEKIKGVHLTLDEFTCENELLTPSLKQVRYKIEQKYENELQALLTAGIGNPSHPSHEDSGKSD